MSVIQGSTPFDYTQMYKSQGDSSNSPGLKGLSDSIANFKTESAKTDPSSGNTNSTATSASAPAVTNPIAGSGPNIFANSGLSALKQQKDAMPARQAGLFANMDKLMALRAKYGDQGVGKNPPQEVAQNTEQKGQRLMLNG